MQWPLWVVRHTCVQSSRVKSVTKKCLETTQNSCCMIECLENLAVPCLPCRWALGKDHITSRDQTSSVQGARLSQTSHEMAGTYTCKYWKYKMAATKQKMEIVYLIHPLIWCHELKAKEKTLGLTCWRKHSRQHTIRLIHQCWSKTNRLWKTGRVKITLHKNYMYMTVLYCLMNYLQNT